MARGLSDAWLGVIPHGTCLCAAGRKQFYCTHDMQLAHMTIYEAHERLVLGPVHEWSSLPPPTPPLAQGSSMVSLASKGIRCRVSILYVGPGCSYSYSYRLLRTAVACRCGRVPCGSCGHVPSEDRTLARGRGQLQSGRQRHDSRQWPQTPTF